MDARFSTLQTSSGVLLILGFAAFFAGAAMFWIRGGMRDAAPPSPRYFVWERGFILAAVVLTAIGLALLEGYLEATDGWALARTGAAAYFFGGVLIVAAEGLGLAQPFQPDWLSRTYPLVVVYVVLAFLSQAGIGASLLQAGLLAPWVGWAAIIWNIGWLVVSVFVPNAMYIPFFHHLIPLVIGIALILQGP